MEYIRKSLLYKSNVEFEDYALNHIEGCSHNCRYPCYARLIKRKSEKEWQNIKLVSNAMDLLEKELPVLKNKIQQVHMCFSTDPFMYQQDEVIELSLQIIKKLVENNVKVKTLTKGVIPEEILGIEMNRYIHNSGELFEVDENNKINEYGITITTLNENFRKTFEPNTAKYRDRITALKQLSKNKLYTYVYCEPFSPKLCSIEEFVDLLNEIQFVNKIYWGCWQYNERFKSKTGYQKYYEVLRQFCIEKNIQLKLKKELYVYAGGRR